jgi:hypothetical protein
MVPASSQEDEEEEITFLREDVARGRGLRLRGNGAPVSCAWLESGMGSFVCGASVVAVALVVAVASIVVLASSVVVLIAIGSEMGS